jgi:hypothetical protein
LYTGLQCFDEHDLTTAYWNDVQDEFEKGKMHAWTLSDDASLLSTMDPGVRPAIALDSKLPKLSAKEQRQADAFVALM